MTAPYTDDELTRRVTSPGWRLVAGSNDNPVTGTLEDVLRATHERRQDGQAPGLIEELETAIELDMLQIEKLWLYLGLPV